MKLLTYKTNRKLKLGLKTDAGIIDVKKAGAALDIKVPQSPRAIYAMGLMRCPFSRNWRIKHHRKRRQPMDAG